jgi:hypothetical protein
MVGFIFLAGFIAGIFADIVIEYIMNRLGK